MKSSLYRTYVRSLAGILGAAILVAPAIARASIPSAILPQPKAPVEIDRCVGDLASTDVGNRRYYFETGVAFSNVGTENAAAIRIRFDTYNAFREHLRTYYGSSSDPLAAGAHEHIKPSAKIAALAARGRSLGIAPPTDLMNEVFDPTWEFINLDDTTTVVVCSVDTVMLDSGKKWQAPKLSANLLESAAAQAKRPVPDMILNHP